MQRSITNKRTIEPFFYALIFMVYIGLSSVYLFLPPFLAVLYALFSNSLRDEDTVALAIVSFCLVVFEAEKSYFLFSSIIYFILIYKFVIPKLKQVISCKACVKFLTVIIVYIGFYLFSLLLSNVFLFPIPYIDYYVIYYILIEFLIVNLL